MRFCKACDNMLYITLRAVAARAADGGAESQHPPKLTYVCKHCGNMEEESAAEDAPEGAPAIACVMSTNYADDQTAYKQYATRYITHDPTLPRVTNIMCPSKTCQRPASAPQRVIFVKYDASNLKYLYCCEHCGTFWKSGDTGVVSASIPAKVA
jgi:uncharacterized Zn finger protein